MIVDLYDHPVYSLFVAVLIKTLFWGHCVRGVFVEVFSQFIDSEFDAKTHATRIIQSHAISQQLAKLAEGINLLDRQLHSQVTYLLYCVFLAFALFIDSLVVGQGPNLQNFVK